MAVSEITQSIKDITGISSVSTHSIEDSQRFVVASIPKDLLSFAQKASSASTDGSAISFSVNDSITDVQRNGYSCKEIMMGDAIWALDSTSLRYATSKHPVFYHKQGGVHFAPVTDGSNAGYVFYVDYSLIDDGCDLRNAVIYKAVSQEFTKLAAGGLGSDLSISAVPPSTPSLTSSSVSFSTSVPVYVPPSLQSATAFQSYTSGLTETDPGVFSISAVPPVAPTITASSVSITGTAPTYTPPPMGGLDYSDTENWITTEEDSEMLASRVRVIQTQISEYSARLQEAQGVFAKESAEYQALLQKDLQDAQLESTEEGQKLTKYNADLQKFQQEVVKEVQQYQQKLALYQAELAVSSQTWQKDESDKISRYQAKIQDSLNSFNESNAEYQAQLQVSVQNAQLESQDDAQKIQDYSAKLGEYQQNVAKEVSNYTSTLQKNVQENQQYTGESLKYYQWAQSEVNTYIRNHSKFINKTFAAQKAQQSRQYRR